MYFSKLDLQELTDQEQTELLYPYQDDGKVGDVILVVGSSKCVPYKMPLALFLYDNLRAPTLLLSGGKKWSQQEKVEAQLMADVARHHNIPAEALLVEKKSQSTLENVRFSLELLKTSFPTLENKRLLLVTNSFHMNRLYHIMTTYLPETWQITCCPAEDRHTKKDNWFLSPAGKARVTHELSRLKEDIQRGLIKDYQV